MEICAVHGLRFDPTQHTGCVMCRRGTTDEAIDPEIKERKTAFKIGGAGGAALLLFAGIGLAVTLSNQTEVPPTPPVKPEAAAAVPPDRTETTKQAAVAPKPELPSMLPVASVSGEKPNLVPRMQLEKAKEQCVQSNPQAGGDYACLVAITPLLDQLTQIPVSKSRSEATVRAYEMNRTGLGFDCLWFEVPSLEDWKEPARKEPKVYPYAALLVASPSDRQAQVSLEAKATPFAAQIDGAPWPSSYSAYVTYDGLAAPTRKGMKAQARRYSACMTFPDDKPAVVYASAAAWIGPGPSNKEDDGAAFRATSIEVMGLKGALAAK
jgi:hypothetical protein